MQTGNILDLIPSDLEGEVFETLLESGEVKIERIVSLGHTSPKSGWYDQDKDEWVLVLKGAATIEIEDRGKIDLVSGGYINIPAHCRHKVVWTDPKVKTIWLAIHY